MSIVQQILAFITGLLLTINSLVGTPSIPAIDLSSDSSTTTDASAPDASQSTDPSSIVSNIVSAQPAVSGDLTGGTTQVSGTDTQPFPTDTSVVDSTHVYTDQELLAEASNPYADGTVPLGDNKYVTDAPKKGYVYLCSAHKDNPGSSVIGPWVHGDSWNISQKISVAGSVSWPQATFSNTTTGLYRVLTGNGLPISHTTGTFPVASNDPAATYDPNPNTITAQHISATIPLNPVYSDTPYCMGGEVGIMLSGVPLFDAFDAGLRDAPAHELQDSCDGHPQGSGEYHYHSLSACFKDIGEKTVLGYAYDGYPITGPQVAANKFLTTDNLDECHGITSAITEDGTSVVTYHYVMTADFPYSVSCFHAKPTTIAPSAPSNQNSGAGGGNRSGPPQAAIDACANMTVDASCSFDTPQGSVDGTCRTPPNSALACIP